MSLKIDRVQLEILVKQDSARNKMIELENSIKDVKRQLNIAKKQFGENSEEYKKQEAELKKLKQEYDDLFNEIGIGKLSLKELGNRQRELNAILRHIDPSLPEWKQYNQQLKEVNARIAELKGKARETGLSLSKLSDGFNRYAGVAAAAIASLTGVTLTAKKCVDEYAEMEEAMSQVRKYTGMTTEEVKQLNEEFKRMDTRTAREKLNALAGDAGRLGITGRDGIMEFVDAANVINVALGEDLGEDAVKNIGKLAQMFGEDENMGLRGAMLATASAVNEVAQNSSAAESFLVEFTARVAGVGHQAGLSQADIIGFAAAMDENMLRNETSATAYQKIIMKMFTDTEKFANAAGLNLQEFATLVRTDANEAVLQFAQALSKKGGLADLAPIFGDLQTEGAGVASVLSVMAGKADEIRARQKLANDAYREGTSVINEYNVQNETVQGQLDKAKKRFQDMRIELGEKLLPSMQYMISTGRMTVNILATLVSFVTRFSGEIASLAVGIAVYTAAIKGSTLAMKAYEAATALAKSGMLALDKVTKKNIFGLIASGIASVISYFVWFRNEVDDTNTKMDELGRKAEETKSKLERVGEVQDKLNNQDLLSEGQKKRLRSDVEAAIADLDDVITASKMATRQWYQEQRELLMKEAGDNEILQKSYLSGLEHDLQERAKVIQDYIDQKAKLEAELANMPLSEPGFATNTGGGKNASEIREQERKQQLQAEQMQMAIAYEQQKNIIKQAYIDQQLTEEQYQQQLYDAETAYLMARKALLESYGEDASQLQGQLLDRMIERSNKLYQEAQKAKAEAEKNTADGNKQRLDEQSSQGNERVNDIKKAYINGDIESHQAMLDAIKEAERQNLVERIGLMDEMGMDSSKLQQQLLDMDVQAQQEAEEEKTRIAEEQAQKRKAITSASLNTIGSLAGSMTQLYSAMQDAELSKVERKYDKEIAAAKKAGKDTTKLEEKKEQEQAEIKKKYADKMFAMQVLQITASTAVAAMEAYKAMAGIPIVGPALGAAAAAAAVIAGAAQIAVAKQQRDEAKGLYEGGYSEGYTATGNPREAAGVIPVHKNEFVANHEAVGNPHVKQFLDVFDMAQRNGSIRMLNTPMILEQVRIKGRYDGGYTDTSNQRTTAMGSWSSIPEELRIQLVTLMNENNELLRAIRDKDLVLDPRKVRDSIDRINTLEKNVSRS